MEKKQIREEIKKMLVERLMLRMEPSEISDIAPLFDMSDIELDEEAVTELNMQESDEAGLGLDSVDALEIVVGIKKLFDIQIRQDGNGKIFYSVNTLTDYVYDTMQKAANVEEETKGEETKGEETKGEETKGEETKGEETK